ncbi:MAG: carbohydrate binding domain-containing protein [Candidatus Poribacteria bacterium]|nr:carbohydrate binding domain-containing protein [Candidatus Poribacteria bacterium]
MLKYGLSTVLAMGLSVGIAVAQTNLVTNGDFEGGSTDPFVTYGAATVSLATDGAFDGAASAKVTVDTAGANFWDSGFQYNANIQFAAGTTYTWAAFVKAESAKNINFKPELAVDPWSGFGEAMTAIGTDWAEYHVEFSAPSLVTPASLTMHIAENDVDFWIDNVRWYEGTYVPGNTPTAVEPEGKAATTWASLKTR